MDLSGFLHILKSLRDLQETSGKHGSYANLPCVLHLQVPDGHHGEDQYREIGNHIPDPDGDVIVLDADAVAWHHGVPYPLPRRARKDLEEGLDDVKDEVGPDEDVDPVKDKVALVRDEDPFVLQEDGELCDCDDGAVYDGADI